MPMMSGSVTMFAGLNWMSEPDHRAGAPEHRQHQRRQRQQQEFEALEVEQDENGNGHEGPAGGLEVTDAQQVRRVVIQDGRSGRLGRDAEHGEREFLVGRAFPEILLAVNLEQDFAVGRDEELLQLRRHIRQRQAAVGLLRLEHLDVGLHAGEGAGARRR